MSSLIVLDILLAVISIFIAGKWWFKPSSKPVPPGPRPLPLIGNLFNVPKTYQWKTFAEWSTRAGSDIVSVSLMGQRLVILHSLVAATDLLEKRSAIYSDRPPLPVSGRTLKWGEFVTFSPYGDRFREQRRYLHRYIGSRGQLSKVEPLHGLIEEETRAFLLKTMARPEEFEEHIRDSTGRLILRAAYGYRKQEKDDPIFALVTRVMDTFVKAAQPGSFLVDFVPALQWLPEWLPGMEWKRNLAAWAAEVVEMINRPYETSRAAALRGTGEGNFVSDNIQQVHTSLEEHSLKMAAASLYAGGSDTTVSAIHTFFLAMTLYPEAQMKAQREIDVVIGRDRLPSISDREQLPYVRALVSEVLRWNPVAPLTLPHRVMEDDVYKGYLIPKGSMIFANIWYLMRDPEVYTDPLTFKPERFLTEEGNVPEQDPRSAVFGFGRRICPGLNLAEASIFIACAMVLAVFDIRKAVENGVEVTPEIAYSSGTISHPLSFKCSIKPRSPEARTLVMG